MITLQKIKYNYDEFIIKYDKYFINKLEIFSNTSYFDLDQANLWDLNWLIANQTNFIFVSIYLLLIYEKSTPMRWTRIKLSESHQISKYMVNLWQFFFGENV